MSAVSKTYNRAHNITELVDISYQIFLSQQMKRNVIMTNKKGKSSNVRRLENSLKTPWNYGPASCCLSKLKIL